MTEGLTNFLRFIIDPLHALLSFIHGLGPSWGWSIILLTVIVRLFMVPLTYKQYKSMHEMQRFSPRMREIQQEFKDNAERRNQELFKLYREEKINPFGSCLPSLLQIPVFIALFFMLQAPEVVADISSSDASWLWIENITQPDPLHIFFPGLSLLLLFYVATHFVSIELTQISDPVQKKMMRLLPFGVAIFFVLTPFPAGILMYWVTTNLWTIGQQYYIRRAMGPLPQMEAGQSPLAGLFGGRAAKETAAKTPAPASSAKNSGSESSLQKNTSRPAGNASLPKKPRQRQLAKRRSKRRR